MPQRERVKRTSYIDKDDDNELQAIAERDGILRSEQLRRAVKSWIREVREVRSDERRSANRRSS